MIACNTNILCINKKQSCSIALQNWLLHADALYFVFLFFWSLEIHRKNRSQYINWINNGISIDKKIACSYTVIDFGTKIPAVLSCLNS